jgi:hypothetical protein
LDQMAHREREALLHGQSLACPQGIAFSQVQLDGKVLLFLEKEAKSTGFALPEAQLGQLETWNHSSEKEALIHGGHTSARLREADPGGLGVRSQEIACSRVQFDGKLLFLEKEAKSIGIITSRRVTLHPDSAKRTQGVWGLAPKNWFVPWYN